MSTPRTVETMKAPLLLVAVPATTLAILSLRLAAAPMRGTSPRVVANDRSTGDAAVVDAANTFLATLTDAQKASAQIDMSQASAAKWTNLPAGPNGRNGVQLRSLNEDGLAAALKVARLALGESGFARLQEIRAADDLLGKSDRGGPGGRRGPGGPGGGPGGPPPGGFGGPPPDQQGGPGGPPPGGQGGPGGGRGQGRGPGGGAYSGGNYIVAFLGKPSTSTPWMLQIGGHHLAFNIYYKGATSTATPYFVGVEPQSWKDADGKTHAPLAPMKDAMFDLVNSLTQEQKTQAKLDQRFGDVYLGPRQDGRFPTESKGIAVTSLSNASQALVKKAIAAWTGDCAKAADYQKLYFSELAQTKVAYSGGTTFQQQGDYVRIDGPHVWIEFVCQNGVVMNGIHFHTIWRDRKSDYGASYAF